MNVTPQCNATDVTLQRNAPVTLRDVARLLVVAKRMGVRPRWLDELVAAVTLPAGPPRNPAAIAISGSDASL